MAFDGTENPLLAVRHCPVLPSLTLSSQLNWTIKGGGPSCDRGLTSWPVSSTQSLEHCFLASISTLNMVQTDSGTLKSVDLLAFCILASNADFVLWDKTQRGFWLTEGVTPGAQRSSPQASQNQVSVLLLSFEVFMLEISSDLLTQASIMSLAISLSLCSRCLPNSGSGQWRSSTNICRASSFQNRSSEVAEPLLRRGGRGSRTHQHTLLH